MNTAKPERPSILMSHEEHGAISELTSSIKVLADGQRRTEQTLGKFIEATDNRFSQLSERGKFSRGDVFAFIGAAIGLAGAVGVLLSMRIDMALSPIRTTQQVSIVDRENLHGEVTSIHARIDAGRVERYATEKETAVRRAISDERIGEMYLTLYGRYPRVTPDR